MPLRPLAMRPPKDTLQANGVEGQQVLFMQQPALTQHILLPSVQYLPNRAVATTQQQMQAGGLWIGVTRPNGMYFQPNQPIAQATFPIGAAATRYVGPMYTQVQSTNLNYALLEMDPATTLSARPNYVVHPSNLIPSNDFRLAPAHGSISGINGHVYVQTLMKNVSTFARPCASVGAVPFKVGSVNATGPSLNGINIDTGLPGSGDNRDNIENKSLANGDQGSIFGPDDKYNETDDNSDPQFDDEPDITEHSDSMNEDDNDGDGKGDADVVEYIDLDDNQECAGCEDELEEYNGARAELHQYMAASTEEDDEEDDLPSTQTNIVEGMEEPVVNHSMNGSNELQYETVDVIANQSSKKRKRWPKGVKPPESRQPRDIGAIEKAMRNAQNRATPHIFEPVLGMVFDSRAEAYQFFNLYSWEVGFGIRFGSSAKNRVNKYRTMQELVCEKEESCVSFVKKRIKTMEERQSLLPQGFDPRCTSSSKRERCKAKLRLHRTEDHGWYVSLHVADHNHPFSVSCSENQLWNSHSKIEQCTKDMIRYLREKNVTTSRGHCITASLSGSLDGVPFNQKTLRSICAEIARDQKDDDVMKTLRVFRQMRAEDPGFQFSVDFDEDKRIKTLLWTSGKSRSQWSHFGDVVTFDTTCCTNLYKMPFGIFVGVNNHFQSVLFAGVLMRDETASSFKWVFNEFLTLMGGKAPMTIFTDQCKAMDKAIRSVFPGITHLWCKWQILKDAPLELGTLYSRNSPFRRDFDYIINEMLTEDEFERAWADLLDRYKLQEHPFTIKTYNKRKMWAKPWAKDKFCARMASTQRSESANSMLKKFVPRNSSMNRFVEQYRKLLFICDSAEHKAEHQTKQIVNRSTRIYPIEKHAMSLYTKKAYELFSGEVDKAIHYNVTQGSAKNEFAVVHYNADLREHWRRSMFTVKVVDAGERYICECGLYEHFGMLCCHVIKVLIHSGVSKIPMAHILKRWTQEARDFAYQDIGAGTNDASVTDELRHNLLHANALKVVGRAKNDRQIHDIVARHLKSAMTEIESVVDWRSNKLGSDSASDGSDSASDAEAVNGNSYGAAGISACMSNAETENMQAPAVRLPQGQPICNRRPSALGKIRKGTKEKGSQYESLPVCERCQEEGHTLKSCKLRPKAQEKAANSALNGKKRRLD